MYFIHIQSIVSKAHWWNNSLRLERGGTGMIIGHGPLRRAPAPHFMHKITNDVIEVQHLFAPRKQENSGSPTSARMGAGSSSAMRAGARALLGAGHMALLA